MEYMDKHSAAKKARDNYIAYPTLVTNKMSNPLNKKLMIRSGTSAGLDVFIYV